MDSNPLGPDLRDLCYSGHTQSGLVGMASLPSESVPVGHEGSRPSLLSHGKEPPGVTSLSRWGTPFRVCRPCEGWTCSLAVSLIDYSRAGGRTDGGRRVRFFQGEKSPPN